MFTMVRKNDHPAAIVRRRMTGTVVLLTLLSGLCHQAGFAQPMMNNSADAQLGSGFRVKTSTEMVGPGAHWDNVRMDIATGGNNVAIGAMEFGLEFEANNGSTQFAVTADIGGSAANTYGLSVVDLALRGSVDGYAGNGQRYVSVVLGSRLNTLRTIRGLPQSARITVSEEAITGSGATAVRLKVALWVARISGRVVRIFARIEGSSAAEIGADAESRGPAGDVLFGFENSRPAAIGKLVIASSQFLNQGVAGFNGDPAANDVLVVAHPAMSSSVGSALPAQTIAKALRISPPNLGLYSFGLGPAVAFGAENVLTVLRQVSDVSNIAGVVVAAFPGNYSAGAISFTVDGLNIRYNN